MLIHHKGLWDITMATVICICPLLTCRYITMGSGAVKLLQDGDLNTFWRSKDEETSVNVTVGLMAPLSISKVFIRFQSPLPQAATLRYLPNGSTEWRDLQYFADDCSTRFSLSSNAEWAALASAILLNCSVILWATDNTHELYDQ